MAKDAIEFDGEITEVLAGGVYRIKLLEGMEDVEVRGYLAGKMRKFSISIIVGDRVRVELNQYDPMKSRVVYRYRPGESKHTMGQGDSDVKNKKKEEKVAKLKEQERYEIDADGNEQLVEKSTEGEG